MNKKIYALVTYSLVLSSIIFFVSAGVTTKAQNTARNYRNGADLYTLIEKQDEPYLLLDVRTEEEYNQGHIPTSINIAFDIIKNNIPTSKKDTLIIVYCRSGRRSSIASETLSSLGYTNIVDFGGITNWPGELEH